MVKHQAGVERMARAIKQSVDGSGYPSSALFPITGETEAEEGRGPSGRRYLCDGRGYGRTSGEERTIYIFGPVVASSLHECIAARKRKGGKDQQDGITIHREVLNKTWTVYVVRINKLCAFKKLHSACRNELQFSGHPVLCWRKWILPT